MEPLFSPITVKKTATHIRAINHKLRHTMLQQIQAAGQITVTDLYVKLRLEQAVCSQHLAILRQSGFVHTRREGKQIYYSVNQERLGFVLGLCETINQLGKTTLKKAI